MQRAILAHRFDRGDNVHGPAETGNQWMADDPVDCVERGRDRAPRTSLPRPSRARLHALFGQRARPGAKGETVHHVPRRNQGLEAAGFANPAQHLVVFRAYSRDLGLTSAARGCARCQSLSRRSSSTSLGTSWRALAMSSTSALGANSSPSQTYMSGSSGSAPTRMKLDDPSGSSSTTGVHGPALARPAASSSRSSSSWLTMSD